ncbi:MAG: hypothetical protein WA985_08620 [Erythrobacter sp.]|uniref:hypothetical protein n=1 Tax=Erythrobacter sp. TaxID=1042 RepID=UPI003C781D5F
MILYFVAILTSAPAAIDPQHDSRFDCVLESAPANFGDQILDNLIAGMAVSEAEDRSAEEDEPAVDFRSLARSCRESSGISDDKANAYATAVYAQVVGSAARKQLANMGFDFSVIDQADYLSHSGALPKLPDRVKEDVRRQVNAFSEENPNRARRVALLTQIYFMQAFLLTISIAQLSAQE